MVPGPRPAHPRSGPGVVFTAHPLVNTKYTEQIEVMSMFTLIFCEHRRRISADWTQDPDLLRERYTGLVTTQS